MSSNTRTEFRAYDVNGNIQGYGENATEAAMDMAATIGDVLKDEDETDGVDWYVLKFEQEQDEDTYEWIDLDDGEEVAASPL